jgi:cytoskeletal protein CcmA (bactofilin family)
MEERKRMFERKQTKPDPAEAPEPGPAAADPAPATSKPPKTASEATAMIGSKVKITGDIESAEDLLIEGEVNGTVTLAENELVVGNAGRVHADIEAKVIRIEGEVRGDVTGRERVVITASGSVEGNLNAPRIMLEDGGRFKGSIDMGGAKVAPAAAPAKAAPAAEGSGGKTSAELPGVTRAS